MLTLFHHPFCLIPFHPAGAKNRLAADLIEERAWSGGRILCSTPPHDAVLVDARHPAVPGVAIIAEYLDEVYGTDLDDRRLLPVDLAARIEVRRLSSWFNDKFFAEVSGPLVIERLYKRFMRAEQGGGSPDTETIRAARNNIRYHVSYIGWLVRTRNWLTGDLLTYADLAAAAHLSTVDYFGDAGRGRERQDLVCAGGARRSARCWRRPCRTAGTKTTRIST